VQKGVYVIGDPRLTLAQCEMAAVLACGPGSALSHRSAARNWRLPYGTCGPIEVTAPTERKLKGVKVHRSRKLRPADTTVHDGIPVTTVRRTLIDLAGCLTPGLLADAVGEARFRKLIGPDERVAVTAEASGRRGSRELLTLLGTEQQLRSELERRCLAILRAAGLPEPLTNHRLTVDAIQNEIDLYWPDAQLCVELDSFLHHGDAAAFERDRARDTRFLVEGLAVVRITWRRLADEPDEVVRQIAAIFQARLSARPA
jgi:very-short-patch-repair endonuclease